MNALHSDNFSSFKIQVLNYSTESIFPLKCDIKNRPITFWTLQEYVSSTIYTVLPNASDTPGDFKRCSRRI